MKILLAHGGRPLWMDTAFFLLRRHPNVYLDISGIPPKSSAAVFPAARGDRAQNALRHGLAGTREFPMSGKNLQDFRALASNHEVQDQILSRTALGIWPGMIRDPLSKG